VEGLRNAAKNGEQPKERMSTNLEMQLSQHAIELPDTAEGKECVIFLFKQFLTYGVLCVSVLSGRLKQSAAAFTHPKNITPTLLVKYMPIIAEEVTGGAWCLKNGGKPEIEPYRRVVLDMFKQSPGCTKHQIDQLSVKQLGKPIPPTIFNEIFKQLLYKSPNNPGHLIFKSGSEAQNKAK